MASFRAALGAWSVVTAVSFAWSVGAQTQSDWRAAKESAPSQQTLSLSQSYTGTTPGAGNALPRVDEIKGRPENWITWPGFMMRADGSSRLFIQTTRELSFEKIAKKKRVRLVLAGAKIHLRNNRNPLVTENFNTPLKAAFLKKTKKGVELVLELKTAVEGSVSQTVDADGYCYLFVDFPSGEYETGGAFRPSVTASGSAGNGGATTGAWEPLLSAPSASGGVSEPSPPAAPRDVAEPRAPAAPVPPSAAEPSAADEEPPADAPDDEIFPAT